MTSALVCLGLEMEDLDDETSACECEVLSGLLSSEDEDELAVRWHTHLS